MDGISTLLSSRPDIVCFCWQSRGSRVQQRSSLARCNPADGAVFLSILLKWVFWQYHEKIKIWLIRIHWGSLTYCLSLIQGHVIMKRLQIHFFRAKMVKCIPEVVLGLLLLRSRQCIPTRLVNTRCLFFWFNIAMLKEDTMGYSIKIIMTPNLNTWTFSLMVTGKVSNEGCRKRAEGSWWAR